MKSYEITYGVGKGLARKFDCFGRAVFIGDRERRPVAAATYCNECCDSRSGKEFECFHKKYNFIFGIP